MIDTRLDWATGTIGQLAQRATVEVDDQSVAERLAGLSQDASSSWRDRAHLRKLGRTAVNELRYQGERRGWEPVETDTRVRAGLSDLYAGAVEAAIGQDDLDGAAALYDHARPVLAPERQAAIDRRFEKAREVAFYRDIDRDLSGLPLDPAGPPGLDVFESRAAELTPDDASDEVRARVAQVADHAHRHAERQWHRRQAEAGLAALAWLERSPNRPLLAMPPDIRDWLDPGQWRGLETFYIEGRLGTDQDLFERLDWQMVHEPDSFAAVDLDRHRLSLGDADYTRFTGAQKAIAEGRIDPALARYDRLRLGIDRALEARDIDTDGPAAVKARADARGRLKSFEIIEDRPPVGADLDDIVRRAVDGVVPEARESQPDESVPVATPLQRTAPSDVFGGAEPRVVHGDDGSTEVTAGEIATPAGPAAATVRIDGDRRGASAEVALPGGGRVESRRTSPDGRTWSQVDTIRDPRGAVVGTQTTTFDGTRIVQTWTPADGPAQTSSREAKPPAGDVHLASADEAALGFGVLGAMVALPVAPAVAAAIVVGLGLFAAHKAYQHFTAPGGLEDRPGGAISKAVPPEEQPKVVPQEGQPDAAGEKGQGSEAEPGESVKVKDLTRLSNGEIRMLKKGRFDIHDEKDKDNTGPVDLFKDRQGNIYSGRQDGQGEATATGHNIKNYR